MTVSSILAKAGPFTGNDVTVVYPFTFKVFVKADLRVVFTDAGGVESDLVLDSDYSVALNADQNASPGGSITYPLVGAPLTTTEKLTLVSNVPDLQLTDITNAGGFFPQVVEDMSDKRTILSHQIREALDRAFKFAVSDGVLSTDLPSAASRANKFLGFDSLGNILLATISAGTILFSPTSQFFNGTGAQTAFTLSSAPGSANALIVAISGVVQKPNTDFTVAGTTLTFTTAPAIGVNNIAVQNFGVAGVVNAAGASQVSYTPPFAGGVLRTQESKNTDSVHIKDFGAVCDGVADDTAAVLAAVAALTPGGTVRYSGTPLLSANVTISKKLRLVGEGGLGTSLSDLPASYFIKKSTMTTPAITVIEDGVILQGGGVVGQVGNAGDNIVITANGVLALYVTSMRAGQDGFRHGSDIAGNNANGVLLVMCHADSNVRHGFFTRDFNSNNNVSTWLNCAARLNGGDGFRNGIAGSAAQGSNNKYINGIGESNTGQGINIIGGAGNHIDGGDYEANVAGQVLIGVDAVQTTLSNHRAAFTLVDNSITTIRLDNMIQKEGLWVPVLAGSTTPGVQTYGEQLGTWKRVGGMIHISWRIGLTAKDAATAGSMRITGLPFAFAGGVNNLVGCSIAQWGQITFPANYHHLQAQILNANNFISLVRGGSGQTAAFVAAAEIGATTQCHGSAWYPIATL